MDKNTATPEVASDNIFESAWNDYVKPAVSAIGDVAGNIYDATVDTVKEVASWDFDIFDNDAINDARKIQQTSVVSDDDRKLAKDLNEYSWWEMAKDLSSGLFALGKNKLFWSPLSSKLKIWEDDFNKWLEWFTTRRDSIQKELDQISSQYQTVTKVNSDAEAKYKTERWVSSITDYEDFNAFRMEYIRWLDPITFKKVQFEITDMQQKAWSKLEELNTIDSSMRDYLTTNVEWWVEAYDKINQEQANVAKWNKYFEMIQKISEKESLKLDDELNKRWASMSKLWSKFSDLRDSVLEDRTADQQYYLSLLGMDIPDNEKIAEQFKKSSDISKKFNIDLLTNIANNRDLPEYSTLSEVDYRSKMMEVTWKSLTNEEKDLFRKKETIVTWVQQLQEKKSMWERAIYNPMLVLDAVNYLWATMQWIIDQVYDYEWWVPNYVKSESRNIIYSDEWLLEKAKSSVLYNTDALVSFAAMWWALKLAKITKLDSLAASATDKILKIPTKIGFWEWAVNIIWSGIKGTTKSLISNAATDPIFDSVMQEAPTDAIQEFNTLTGPLFDAGFWALMKWGSRVVKKTWNELLYEFMTKGEDKAVIEDLVSFYKGNWNEITKDEARTILSEWSKQILSITNPDRIKEIFTKPWELYNFVSSNVKNMENNGMKSLITETGLWINIEKLLWVPEGTYSDIKSLATYINTVKDIPDNTKRVVQATLDKHFDNIQAFIDWKMMGWVRVMNSSFTNPEYKSIQDSVSTGIKNIKNILAGSKWTTYLDEVMDQIDYIQDSIWEIHKRFTNQKTIKKVNIHPINDPKKVVSISIDDLDSIEWMSWWDIIRTWIVTIPAWKWIEQWEYVMAGIKSSNVKTTFSSFMNWKRLEVQNYMTERWYGHIDIWKTVENVLSWGDRKKAVQIWFLNDIAKKEWIEKAEKEADAFSEFILKTFEDFYWKENVGSKFNINKIDAIKKNENDIFANDADYISFVNSQEGWYNLMYGHFKWKQWVTFSMHYTFWKKFNWEPFSHKLTWNYKSSNEKTTFNNFLQSTWSINDTIIAHAKRWDVFDFDTWLARARAIESVWSPSELFTDWKLSKQSIEWLLSKVWISDTVATDFVFNVLKNLDTSYADLVRPMIYNLAHTYHTNKHVVDALVKWLKATDKHIEAFASIILSPSIFKWVADKITRKDSEEVLSLIRGNLDKEMAILHASNLDKISDLEKKINVLKEIKSSVSNKNRKEELELEIQKTVKQINSIKKWKVDEISIVNKLTEKRLKDMAKTFAMSVISWKELRYTDEAKIMKSIQEAKNLPKESKDLLLEALKQMDDAKSSKDLYKIIDTIKWLSDSRYNPVREYIDAHLWRIMSEWHVNIIDEEALNKNLIDAEWLYDPEYLKDKINNPIIKSLSAFINNNYGWMDQWFNKAFRKLFWFTWNETIDEMYSIKDSEFKQFVDSLIAKDENNIPDKKKIIRDKFKNLDKYIEFNTTKWNMFDEVLDIALSDRVFVEKILSVTRIVSSDKIKTFDVVKRYEKWKQIVELELVSNSMEKVLQIENMHGTKSIFINWVWMNWFASLIEWSGENVDKYKKFIYEVNEKQNQKILDQLQVPRWYFFVWNFWDKDSVFSFYRTDLEIFDSKIAIHEKAKITLDLYLYDYAYRNWYFKSWSYKNIQEWLKWYVFKTYSEFQKVFDWLKKDNEILQIDKEIRKREAFNMSNFTTFDEVKIPLSTYVIEPMLQVPEWLKKYCKFDDNWEFDSFNELYNEEEVRAVIQSLDDYHWENIADLSSDELIDYIKLSFLKDNQDGTSFVSKNLSKIRWLIRWVDDIHQFKDHFYWNNVDEIRFWAKTLFNSSIIHIDWKQTDNVVAIWISSAKLKKWRMKNSIVKEITINWRKYKVIWEIEWTDTSYFKNASSDTNKTETEISFSDSIKPKLSKEASDKIEEIQLKRIAEAFDRHIASLWKFAIDTNSYWEAIESIKKISSIASMWRWDTSVVQWKLKDFISEVNQIINKPKEEWQSMFIMQSDSRLKMNEILISKKSQLAQSIQKIEWREWDYVVWYRYPVPSKYNLWLYKVRYIEDEGEEFVMYKNMWDHQVVLNPFVTYVKVEWDNDWDHLFFLSADSEMWKIIKYDILGWQDINSYRNWFILAEQVDKNIPKEITKQNNILESRTVALEAKNAIWVVSATIRSIYLLDQLILSYMADRSNKEISSYKIPYLVKEMVWEKEKTILTTTTIEELVNKYFPGEYWLPDKFAQKAASLLQLTLDFGNSWKTSFDASEIKKLVENMFPSSEQTDLIDEFYETVIKPVSTNYWVENDIKYVSDIVHMWYSSKWKISKLDKVVGSKRSLYKKVINLYSKHLEFLNTPNEFGRLVKTINALWYWETLKPVMEYITKDNTAKRLIDRAIFWKDWDKYIAEQTVWKKIRELIKESFKDNAWVMSKLDNIDQIYNAPKTDYEKLDQLKKSILTIGKSTDAKNAIWLYAMTYWEKYAFHFLWDSQRVKFFSIADKEFLDRMTSMYWDKISDWEKSMTKEERIADIDNAIEWFSWILSDWEEERLKDLIRKRDELADSIQKAEVEVPISDDLIPNESYEFPDFFTEITDVNPQSINELISEHTDYVSKAMEWSKVLMSSLFNQLFPRLKVTYDEMKFLDAVRNGPIQIAGEEHTKQFSNQVVLGMWYKNSIYQQLKRSWLDKDKIAKISREMQSGFLSYKDWKYELNSLDDMIRNTSALFEAKKIADLTTNSDFVKEIESYREKVMVPVIEAVWYIQNYLWYDIHKAYETFDFSMITDIIEARKWDAQLALRLNWIHTKDEFKIQLKENARLLWQTIKEWTVNAMANNVYKSQSQMEAVLNFFKSWHYTMTYGTGWFFTGNAIVSWLAQILPNLVELNSYRLFNKQELSVAEALIKKHRFLASEDVLAKGTWHGMNMNASWLELFLGKITRDFGNTLTDATWKAIGKVNENLWSKIVWSRKAWEYMDSIMNNMLWFNDYPLEQMRKQVAVVRTMNNMGIRNLDQFEDAVERGWKNFLSQFESKARTQFAETWGWAVSSSPFERGTLFEHANEYFNNWFTSFAVKSLSYLMWWSFHKFGTLIEKESAWIVWMKKLVSGDLKWAKTHMSDFLSYNAMLAKQYAYVTWIYLKFQKYEKDNQDRLSLDEFQSSFNNSIVAIEILLWRHMEAWKVSWELWNTEDQLSYTAYTVFDRMFRLFKQPRFFTVMYDKYRSDEMVKWEWDMTDAFFYAVDKQYTSFMRFNWLVDTENMLSKLSSSDMWMLWVWGSTNEEKLFEELSAGGRFSSYQDKWFIGSFLNMFTSMVKTKKSDLWMNEWTEAAQQIMELVMKDSELSKLVNAWTIWFGKNEYNLSNILGTGILSEENFGNTKELWNLIQERAYNTLDSKWRRLLTGRDGEKFAERNILSFTENVIDNILKEQGITMEQIFSMNPDTQKERLKLMTVLNLEKWVSTPMFIAYMMNKEYYDTRTKLQSEIGQFTGEKSKYWTPYKGLSDEQEWKIRRDIMLKYQEMMNYDRTMVGDVLSVAVQKTWEDVFKKFDTLTNWKFMRDNVVDLVNREYLAKSIMARWDTSASSLLSKYALAFKWITSNEEWAKAILKFINDVNSLPYMEKKAKLANTSAMLMALNKTQYNLLKDNKKFQELTKDSQTQLANWLYDTIKWWYDFDSESIDSKLNNSAFKKNYIKPYYPKGKSQSFWWQRPNFSKQFSPLQDYMRWKEGLLAKDPSSYLQSKNWFEYQSPMRVWDPQNPYMRQYSKYAIEQIYFGQKSKWLIATREEGNNKFEDWKKKNINIAKAKKVKKPKPRQSKTFFKEVSKWLMPNLPFSNY